MLGHDKDQGTGLSSLEQKKEFLRYLYRAWSGLTKYIYQQCAVNGKCVDFPLVGRFYYRQSGSEDERQKLKFTFIPHLDFINSGRFAFPQNDFNVSPLSKRVTKVDSLKISLGAISAACEYDRDIVASILKDVMSLFVSLIFHFAYYFR